MPLALTLQRKNQRRKVWRSKETSRTSENSDLMRYTPSIPHLEVRASCRMEAQKPRYRMPSPREWGVRNKRWTYILQVVAGGCDEGGAESHLKWQCPVRSKHLARTSLWGSLPQFPGGLHGRSVWRMPHPWFPFNNINSEMAMEASAKEFHDSVQA